MNDNAAIRRSWSVNGRFLNRNATGVDRYAHEILRAIDSLIGEGAPLTRGLALEILCPKGFSKAAPFSNIPVRILPAAPGHLWEQCILPRHTAGGLLSLCNTGPLAAKKQILCIHDANTRLVPESYGFMFRTVYRFLEPMLGRRAAQITTVSHFSQRSLAQFGIAPLDQIEVIYDGSEHVSEWQADRSALRGTDLPRPFVLLVGTKAPHKNIAMICSIAGGLALEGIHLVITGGADAAVYAHQGVAQLAPNVRLLGRVDDDDLACLYRQALCLAFPSRAEGFGLPAVEAMALGCPVISSNASSLPEICGEAALYAAPDDAAGWLEAIRRIANDPMLRQSMVDAGFKRSKRFSWRDGAVRYLELMFALDHANRGDRTRGPRWSNLQRTRGGETA